MQKTNMSPRRHRTVLAAALAVAGILGTGALAAPPAVAAAGEITYTLYTSDNPSADEQDAYPRIRAAMDAAVSRYNNLSDLTKQIDVSYVPGVPTAEANINGDLRFGSNRSFMNERTALHEIAHTIGVGQSGGFFNLCGSGTWSGPQANALIKSWDGPNATISCGGGHFWPYGMNYDNEWSELNADRHVDLIEAMVADGM
jgi:hypothetical protein